MEEKNVRLKDWVCRRRWENIVNIFHQATITNFPFPIDIGHSKLSVKEAQSISLTSVGTGPKAQ